MSDSSDLEGMGELIEVLKGLMNRDCINCPLFYPWDYIADECMHIHSDLNLSHFNCRKIRDKKVDEIVEYIFERSLRSG